MLKTKEITIKIPEDMSEDDAKRGVLNNIKRHLRTSKYSEQQTIEDSINADYQQLLTINNIENIIL